MRVSKFELQVVRRLPDILREGILYVCFECNVVVHLCACGCGEKVVLQIDPDFWRVWYDGETVSLSPSIGNFQYPCRSHYWIEQNRVKWVYDKPENSVKQPKHKKKKSGFIKKLISFF